MDDRSNTSLTLPFTRHSFESGLAEGVELRFSSSGCIFRPSFGLSAPPRTPGLSSSCISGSLSSFFRFALLLDPSSENLLTLWRSDGDFSVGVAALWDSAEGGGDKWYGLKEGTQTGVCY